MKKSVILLLLSLCLLPLRAQNKVYDPNLDGIKQLDEAIEKAKAERKHVFVQVGGNWCGWCLKFHDFVKSQKVAQEVLQKDYVVVKLNNSKENKNKEALKRLEYPQRFGFPVFVVLDSNGRRIHTQNSALLEEGNGYSIQRVVQFLKQWSPAALDPSKYP